MLFLAAGGAESRRRTTERGAGNMDGQKIVGLVICTYLCLLPAAARAQTAVTGAIAGTVKDTSGAVLPGVTVEAASPALIERVRVVVTDDQGLYRIVDL